jgi:hypothetical protein
MKSVGFKEWSLVCDALGGGEQSIILRKGGIAEGGKGFSFQHREFFLFPTFFHEQAAKVRIASVNLPEARDTITIRSYAKVEHALRIDSLRIAEALAPLHILTPEVVQERFGYKNEGLHVAFLRVFELSPFWILQNEKRFAGCRSWIDLPSPPERAFKPVLDEVDHERRRAEFDRVTASSRAESRDPAA